MLPGGVYAASGAQYAGSCTFAPPTMTCSPAATLTFGANVNLDQFDYVATGSVNGAAVNIARMDYRSDGSWTLLTNESLAQFTVLR
jgi:hypothetical protein